MGMRLLVAWLWVMAALLPGYAKSIELPAAVISQTIEGVEVNFPIGLTASRSDPSKPVAIVATIDIIRLDCEGRCLDRSRVGNAKIDLGGKLSHRGTLLSIETPAIRAKVHFHVSPGLVPSSNGNVVAVFQPTVANNRIALSGSIAEFNISNDITRSAADALDLGDTVRDKLGSLLDEALSAPGAGLALPPAVQALGVNLATARFATIDGMPSLVVEGTLPALAGILLNL